ncbi:VanZ family protein [Bacillus tuaregi]|uniref:VanZ family protein n=1 Tax=Bacillus tuaregi TaxID=1816695 RepID=UPI0008F95C72|nr:VanZ family protein [Bacillus tuaregi]
MLKLVLRVFPFIYIVAVWVMSSMPDNAVVELPDSSWDAGIKESLHLIEFGILYVLLVLALLTFRGLSAKWNIILIIIASLYGIIDEIHQSFVPYRSATMIDVVKDITGVLVASWILYSAYHKKRFLKLGKLLRKIKEASTR